MPKLPLVLIFVSEFPPGPGGIGDHAFNLAQQYKSMGFEIQIIAPSRAQFPYQDFDQKSELKIIRYPASGSMPKKILRISKILVNRLRKEKYDLIIVSGIYQVLLTGLIGNWISTRKVGILHGHEVLMGNKIIKYLFGSALKSFNNLIAVSNYSKNVALEIYPFLNIAAISNGINLSKFNFSVKKFGNGPNINQGIKLITVGSLSMRKGQHNVIKCLPFLKKFYPSLEYHMVGLPNNKVYLEELASSLAVSDSINIHGALSDEDMVNMLLRCNICIMLSERQPNGDVEGFGISLLEGNFLGLPAIGAKDCGIEDAIKDNYSGILIDLNKPQELADAILEIKNNFPRFSKQAIDWAKQHNWENVAQKYYEEISYRP